MSPLLVGRLLGTARRIVCGPPTPLARRHLASFNRRTLANAPRRSHPRTGSLWPNLRELWYAARTSWLLARAHWYMRRSLRCRERVDRLHATEGR